MYLGDRGQPSKYRIMRYNYDILIDKEKKLISKFMRKLGFYTIVYDSKFHEIETVYDTDKYLLTTAGLILRKKQTATRSYFSLVRISSLPSLRDREKSAFLGECEAGDQPSDFPVQIADGINNIFNNLFTINLVDVVQHCSPYIISDVSGNRYRIVSGTGYEAMISYELIRAKDARTGKKAKFKNFSITMELDPLFEKEREHILETIDRFCKELVPLNRNHFEISEVAVKPRVPADIEQQKGKKKEKKKKEEKVEE